MTSAGDWRLNGARAGLALRLTELEDTRFLSSRAFFDTWAQGRKSFRMEHFYRLMRRKTGFLMQGDQPEGGQWNYDAENCKAIKPDLFRKSPLRFAPNAVTQQVIELVSAQFGDHFGAVAGFDWATTRQEAHRALDAFVTNALPRFGDEQDAMLCDDPMLSHSLLSPYMNLGLLSPQEVCTTVEAAYHAGKVPINAAEGYIRQVIGWREYMRGIYHLQGPDYATSNGLGHHAPLPPVYWGAPSKMACRRAAVDQTKRYAYAHHIRRLMVTGNFALLAGVSPQELHEWYLSVYIDAFEWVEVPNTIGMSQWTDGGLVASKPYIALGAYIDRMSDYYKSCHYSVVEKLGDRACPFNALYWHFLNRHRAFFKRNPRMGQAYHLWDGFTPERQAALIAKGQAIICDLAANRPV